MTAAPPNLPRLAIFGDSHYACLRRAHGLGLVDVSGVEIEYWGHVGTRFNHLTLSNGAITPTDDFTAARFAKFNAKGRRFLPAADFDMILVAGARTYVGPLFRHILHATAHGPFLSSGLRRRMLQDGLATQSGYRLARGIAATGTARVVLSPVAFYTEGHQGRSGPVTPEVRSTDAATRAELWQLVAEIAAADGIDLIPQPEETVTEGIFTRADFAVDGYLEKKDFEHRNPAYGAFILARSLGMLRQMRLGRQPGLAVVHPALQDDKSQSEGPECCN